MVTGPADCVVPAALAVPGDLVICRGYPAEVTFVDMFPPGGHHGSPLYSAMVARRVTTARGERWLGHAPGGAYRGCGILEQCPDGVKFDG